MSTQTIAEYLDEERQKYAANQLRVDEEAARIQPLQHGHHRAAKQPKLELVRPAKLATKKKQKRKVVVISRNKQAAARKTSAKTRKRA
jgi:hypothetical protein